MEIVVLGNQTKGHDKYGPTTVIPSQNKFFINGKAVVIDGDQIVPHPHAGTVEARLSNLYINNVRVAVVGDKITCGDTIINGNSRVDIT